MATKYREFDNNSHTENEAKLFVNIPAHTNREHLANKMLTRLVILEFNNSLRRGYETNLHKALNHAITDVCTEMTNQIAMFSANNIRE